MTLVDVALGTKNRTTLLTTLENLASQTIAGQFSLFIMDGNADDRVGEVLKARAWPFARIETFRDAEALPGPVRTWPMIYNYLLARGSSPYLTYWSDDVVIDRVDAFEFATTRLDDREFGAAAFAKLDPGNPCFHVPVRAFGFSVHFGLIKRKTFEQVGGLDEGYRFWYADDDLSIRLVVSGKRVLPLPQFQVTNSRAEWVNGDAAFGGDRERFERTWPWLQTEGGVRTLIANLQAAGQA